MKLSSAVVLVVSSNINSYCLAFVIASVSRNLKLSNMKKLSNQVNIISSKQTELICLSSDGDAMSAFCASSTLQSLIIFPCGCIEL